MATCPGCGGELYRPTHLGQVHRATGEGACPTPETFRCHRPGCVITDPHVCPVDDPAEYMPRTVRTYPPQWPQPGAAPLTAPESTPGVPGVPTEKISGTVTTGADRAVRRAMLLRTGSALWWRAGASKGLPMSPRMRATFQPDPEVIGMVEDAARAEDAHRSDVEAVEIIGQYVPQPDGNGGKVLRRPADVPDAAARAREAGRVSSTRLPHASIVGYTLHFTCSGITVVCDRCREERELENPPDHALIAVVRDAMLHSERCTG